MFGERAASRRYEPHVLHVSRVADRADGPGGFQCHPLLTVATSVIRRPWEKHSTSPRRRALATRIFRCPTSTTTLGVISCASPTMTAPTTSRPSRKRGPSIDHLPKMQRDRLVRLRPQSREAMRGLLHAFRWLVATLGDARRHGCEVRRLPLAGVRHDDHQGPV